MVKYLVKTTWYGDHVVEAEYVQEHTADGDQLRALKFVNGRESQEEANAREAGRQGYGADILRFTREFGQAFRNDRIIKVFNLDHVVSYEIVT